MTEIEKGAARDALEVVFKDLEEGYQLTFAHIAKVFGDEFWMMLVTCLIDAQDAARAIQGAMNKLARAKAQENKDEVAVEG